MSRMKMLWVWIVLVLASTVVAAQAPQPQPIVYRPSLGDWFLAPNGAPIQWGQAGDIPLVADLDGDGLPELVVWRPSNQTFYILHSASTPAYTAAQAFTFGLAGDVPFLSDIDHDGNVDLVVFRPSTSVWYYLAGPTFSTTFSTQWGLAGDIPIVPSR